MGVRPIVGVMDDRLVLTGGDDRSELLAHRLVGHSLHTASATLASFDAALCGFRDSGPGTGAASLALRCGSGNFRRADQGGQLVRVMSWRGAPHLHRRSDLGPIRAAMATAEPGDLEAVAGDLSDAVAAIDDPVGQIATAMAEHFDRTPADEGVTKDALSSAVTLLVDSVLVAYCQRCGADHIGDGMFRLATLRAGLELEHTAKTQTYIRPSAVDCGMPSDPDRAHARTRCASVAAAVSVVTNKNALADWFGWHPSSVVAAIHEPVTLTRRSRATRNVRLLPARDPWLNGSDRPWLLGDEIDRRKDVFRSLGAPGIVLADGEMVGTWRQRAQQSRLTIELEPWRKLSSSEQDELDADADTVADTRNLDAHLNLAT